MSEKITIQEAKPFEADPLSELKSFTYPYMELEVGQEFVVDLEGLKGSTQKARQFIWSRKPKGTDRWWTSKMERPAESAPRLHVIRLK